MELSHFWKNSKQAHQTSSEHRIGQYVRGTGHHSEAKEANELTLSRINSAQQDTHSNESINKIGRNGCFQTCTHSKLSGNEADHKNILTLASKDYPHENQKVLSFVEQSEIAPILEETSFKEKKQVIKASKIKSSTKNESSIEQKINQEQRRNYKKEVTEDRQKFDKQKVEQTVPVCQEQKQQSKLFKEIHVLHDSFEANKFMRTTYESSSLHDDLQNRGSGEHSWVCIQDITTKEQLDDDKSSSSSQEQERRRGIWDQSQYQIQDIEKMKEKDIGYSSGSESGDFASQTRIRSFQTLKEENEALLRENVQFKAENSQIKEQLSILEHKKCFILRLLDNERMQQLLDQNKELNDLILEHKINDYQTSLVLNQLKTKTGHYEEELKLLNIKLQKKEDYINNLISLIEDKTHQCEQSEVVIKSLQETIRKLAIDHENRVDELQHQIKDLNQAVEFYKDRIEEDGFTLNMEEVKNIKEMFDKQAENQEKVVSDMSKEHRSSLLSLQRSNQAYISQIADLKQKNSEANKQQLQKQLALQSKQIKEVMNSYDCELQSRDNQIVSLRKELNENQELLVEVNLNNCKAYYMQVDKLRTLILDQDIQRYSEPQLVMEFQYIVSKLTKMLTVAEKKILYMTEEKEGLFKYVNQKELLFKEESDRSSVKILQLQAEVKLLKTTNEQLSKNVDKLRQKRDASALFESSRSSLCSSILSTPNREDSLILKEDSCILKQSDLESSFMKGSPAKVPQFTLQQLLKTSWLCLQDKRQLSIALILFAQRMLKENKKKVSLKPSQIMVSPVKGAFEISMIKTSSKVSDESEKSLIYSSPEVLLGFSESEYTYVWTIGLMIDCIFHGSLFFKKISEVTSRSQNYYCRDQSLSVRVALQTMMKKKQKQRCLLQTAKALLIDAKC